jgi:WD40 repeat protein
LGETDHGSGQVLIWDSSTGRLIRTLGKRAPAGDNGIVDLAFSRDGKLLASAGFDGNARVWEVASDDEILTLPAQAFVLSVAFSPDGNLLASSGSDGTVKVWDVSSGAEVQSLAGHLGAVLSVAFSPDGRLLATAGFDNTARLWDVSTGREVLELTGHTLGLTDAAFSPDGTQLATSSNDGTVRVYVLPIQDLIDLARSRLTRSWTEDECRQYLHLDRCGASS